MTVPEHQRQYEQTVEALLRRISALVVERQQLRVGSDGTRELERNRLEIVRCQQELNQQLGELYRRAA